ncbi:MAG: YqaA family protein [Candidatus Pelagibacter sp.]
MFKKLYDKSLELASNKRSNLYLGIVSFIESSFFPIPPDVMIVPMVLAKKNSYLKIFLIATVFSVLGGIFGYLIGHLFIDLAMHVIEFYSYENKVLKLKMDLSQGSGMMIWLGTLFLAGFTPLPYKVFTITSGLIAFDVFAFIIISFISRGLRFFLVSFLTVKFGEKFVKLIEQKGAVWSSVIGIIIVFIVVFFLRYAK